jgi:tetratricopeptide (TPR) repeat protein
MNFRTLFLGAFGLLFLFSCNTEVEYIEKGEIDKAIDYCNNAAAEDQSACYQNIADYYYANEDYENAAKFYDKTADEALKDKIDSCLKEVVAENYAGKDTKVEDLTAFADELENEATKAIYLNYLAKKLIEDQRLKEAAKIYNKTGNTSGIQNVAFSYIRLGNFEESITVFSELGEDEAVQLLKTAKENLPTTFDKLDKPISAFIHQRISEDQLLDRTSSILEEVDYVRNIVVLAALLHKYTKESTNEYFEMRYNDNRPYDERKLARLRAKAEIANILFNMQKETDDAIMEEISKLIPEK